MKPKCDLGITFGVFLCLFFGNVLTSVWAAPVYISDFSDFPAYPYNTSSYMQGGAYVGCGPTTGAMIFGYFDHVNNLTTNGLLTNPGTGVNEGLNTAWVLHGSTYMNTGSNGFGSVYNIEPGLENYAENRGYQVKVMIHASPSYDPNSSDSDWLNDYGAYGESWDNNGYFWRNDGGNWDIDASDFCDFVEDKITAGVTIFLTIDTDMDKNGDHWVPLVGFDRSTDRYAYYDTYNTTVHWADIHYCGAAGAAVDNAISFLRSVAYVGSLTPQVNPPTDLVALNGYHGRIPLAWNQPAGSGIAASNIMQIQEIHPPASEPLFSRKVNTVTSNKSILAKFLEPVMPMIDFDFSVPTVHALQGYNVYRATSSGGSYTKIASNISRQYFKDEQVANGVTYYYKVTAVYNEGESDFSNVANAKSVKDGYTIKAGWSSSSPTIDGLIKNSEWADATKTEITYPGYPESVIMYVMNDDNYLYIAVDDVRDNSMEHLDQFALVFDENFDQEWPPSEPTGEGFIWLAWDNNNSKAISVWGGRYGYWPFNIGLVTNVMDPAGVTPGISLSSGHMQYEGRYNFSTSPLNTTSQYKIGILVFVYDYDPQYFNAFWPQEAVKLGDITPYISSWGTAPFSFGVLETAGNESPTEPDIAISPMTWNFGDVSVGAHSDKTFTISNNGNANLSVTDITASGDLTQFDIVSGAGSAVLAPGATRNVVVRFAPTSTGTKTASVQVSSNDPDESLVQVSVSGNGVSVSNPVLSVVPTLLDFGTEETSLAFQVSNTGSGTLTWTVAENPDKPWITSVTPASGSNNAAVTVTVDRSQLAGESDNGTLSVTSNGGNQNVTVNIQKADEALPDHWQFTSNTGNLATIVLPVDANPNIDGEPLMNGDYVGIFNDQGMCCGWSQWEGDNLSLTAWGDNDQTTEKDGLLAGEVIQYRVYRGSVPREWQHVVSGYSTGNGMYTPNGFMVLDQFDVMDQMCITLHLLNGWNMFSINVMPDDPDISHVFGDLADDIVIIKSGTGEAYIPEYGINNIGEMLFDKGYQAYIQKAGGAMIDICGGPVGPATPISLNVGWAMISYLPQAPIHADVALATIADKLVLAKNNNGQTFIPSYGINDLGEMQPGQGYQLYMNSVGTLVYPSGALAKKQTQDKKYVYTTPQHFEFVSNTGENATVVVTSENAPQYADGAQLQTGDEIGVFNTMGMCCGAGVWGGVNMAITVWGDDQQTNEPDGFTVGDTLRFRIWSNASDTEYETSIVFQEGSPCVYQVNGFSVLNQIIAVINTGVENGMNTAPVVFRLLQNYPNPFNPVTTIIYDVPQVCHVDLEIYNVSGQLLETLYTGIQQPGQWRITWNASQYPSGVYFYKIKADRYLMMRKMVLMK